MPSDGRLAARSRWSPAPVKASVRPSPAHSPRPGAQVVVADIEVDAAEQTARDIESSGGRALACEVDVASAESQDRLFARVRQTYDRLDILVNNAGIFHVAPFLEFPLEAWRRVFAVNLDGALLATQRAGELMQSQTPHRGDRLSRQDHQHQLWRGGARSALPGRLRREQSRAEPPVQDVGAGARRTRASATTIVNPTSVREGMFGPIADQMAEFEGMTPEEFEAQRAAGSPLGRLQKPEEVGAIASGSPRAQGMGLNGRLVYTEAHVGRVP